MPGVRGLACAGAFLLAVVAPAIAEVAEPQPTRSQGSGAPAVRSSDGTSVNITQPKLQVTVPTSLLAPVEQTKTRVSKPKKTKRKAVRKRITKRKTRTKRRTRKSNAEARWWEKTGNPAVFAFRDCLNGDVTSALVVLQDLSEHDRIIRAMDGNCSDEFDHMAKTLSARFGEKGFRRLSLELIQTTFLPAAAIGQ